MEYWFTELGYFAEEVCKSLQEEFDGVTYFNIKVKYSNCAGNCTLGIESNAKNMKENSNGSVIPVKKEASAAENINAPIFFLFSLSAD